MSDGGSPAWTNWVGNQTFAPKQVVTVDSEADVQREVASAVSGGHTVRTVGTAHSFTPIVETDVLLDTSSLRGIVEVDRRNQVVRAEVVTSVPLSKDRADAIERGLSSLTGKRVSMVSRVDDRIIGGMVARVGSTVYDGSLATQLRRIKERLMT